ncbi:hypothetical protein F5141DRAFT_1217625 [Pisolithus sp. B1]|nr:hypothetical protein F5141DRAFT_1217625 [Pisolithus sp. B1]
MINKEALRFLKQYASRAITLEVAMEEIQYILESNFDEDEWMDITQYILIDPLCFADIEKEFLEKLGEQESSNATSMFLLFMLLKLTSDPPNLAGSLEFGPRYVHAEWQPLITALFALSDPSNEDPRSPSSLVKQAMQSHGVSFVTSTNPLLRISARPGKAPQKRRKTGISKFFDLAAAEKDSDEDDKEEEDLAKPDGEQASP